LSSFAIEELTALLGSSFRSKVHPRAASSWARDRFAKGSYSHALPGHSRDRAILAAPVDGRLFFAGEATSSESFSTAHGAYESGVRAANEVASSLGRGKVGTRARRKIPDPAALAQSKGAPIAASGPVSLAVEEARNGARRPPRTQRHKGLNS
jgi:Flavin containing amine oxidoreductase